MKKIATITLILLNELSVAKRMLIKTTYTIILSIFLFTSFVATGQNVVDSLFQKAGDLYDKEQLDSALIIFKDIVKKYPNNPAYPRAFYNVGYLSWQLNKNEDAIKVFLKILKNSFNDNEKGPGEGIMSEPYAIYKHRASSILSEIYISAGNFTTAFHYLVLSDKKYPYRHFCGNEYAANDIYTAVKYSRCYDGLNQIDNAIDVLWNHIFNNGLANNSSVIKQIKIVLLKKYTQQQIETELKEAEKTITVKLKKDDLVGFITIFKHKISLPYYYGMWNKEQSENGLIETEQIQKYLEEYTSSQFYQELIK